MSKQRSKDTPPSPPHHRWPAIARAIVSVLLIVHLTAVLIPPVGLQAQSVAGPSPFVRSLQSALGLYIDAAYLNHGYAFFGPDPGPSHLIEYTVTFDDDREPLTQTFPDLQRHWPRLLYHRHFMLSEHLNAAFVPADPPPRPRRRLDQTNAEWRETEQRWKADVERWGKSREAYETRWYSFKNHLEAKYGGEVEMVRVRHLLHPPALRNDEVDLRAEESYQRAGRDEIFAAPRAEQQREEL